MGLSRPLSGLSESTGEKRNHPDIRLAPLKLGQAVGMDCLARNPC